MDNENKLKNLKKSLFSKKKLVLIQIFIILFTSVFVWNNIYILHFIVLVFFYLEYEMKNNLYKTNCFVRTIVILFLFLNICFRTKIQMYVVIIWNYAMKIKNFVDKFELVLKIFIG